MLKSGWKGNDLSPARRSFCIRAVVLVGSDDPASGDRIVPSADSEGVAGFVSDMAKTAFRVARIDVPKYNGGDVAA